ncbi:MAG: hydantoinase B/oxoprolinase family protein, partial [Phycisphaerae bacterium]
MTLMTSSGGLVSADAAAGKDTILSGPAGGVLGCRHVARRAGFSRTIGFDMGGTSTDVCRVDPPPADLEYTHETVKAGVRLMTPMLAVETVAAGGGSICAFDGQKLTVGPKSAGADPGPACYGRDGPITITDVNLHLGRVVADHFPFTLDRDVVDRKLAELCELVNKASGTDLTPTTLADGFLQIANATMAAAIKRISMARGFDPAEYALTTFGGAGAQHACDIARLLGIGHVVCSPLAGVLSALGIGVADLKRIREQSVHLPLDDGAAATLRPHFESMTDKLRCELIQQGATDDAVTPPKRTLDLCYAGQSTLLTVPADPIEQAAGRFEEQHTRLYGYAHRSRAIEIRVVRVELSARTPGAADVSPIATVADKPPPAAAHRTTPLMVGGRRRDVPLLLRAELRAGHTWDGPAVVIEETSTIVVADGWRAAVAETGDIIMSIASADDGVAAAEGRDVVDARSTDPVQLELFNNRFAEAARRMGVTLQRTALSVNVKERLDFSCAVFTPDGDLVVNAPHIPVHLGAMADCVKALMEDVPRLAPGDVYVTNDPYRGGSHLNDITVITPLFDEAGRRILFFVASRAHHADIGGTRPGSMPPDSTSLAEEGVLISAFPWFRKGTAREEAMRTLLTFAPHPARKPDENLADIAAQVAANHTGARELRALIDRYGLDVVHAYMKHIQDAAERKMRTALAALPDGVRRFTDSLDDGSLIRLTLTIHGDAATLDFTGTGPVLPGNLNANRAIVKSAALYCFRCLIDSDIPLNAGVLAPLDIILPECLLSPPRHSDPSRCPAVAGGNVETSQRVVDVILGALGLVAASQGTMNNLLIGRDAARTSGHRLNKPGSRDDPLQDPPAHRLPFGYYETICGGAGAGDGFHGADAVHTHMTNTRLTDPEVLESRYPVRLLRFAVRTGSGGPGKFVGGCGVIREIEFLEPLEVSIISQRRTMGPYGLRGGKDGLPGRNILLRRGGVEEALTSIASVKVCAGDRLRIETPGGGGWGS